MNLLDNVLNAVQGQGEAGANNPMQAVMELLNNPELGSLKGLVDKFTQGGLGEQVASWVSTGSNLPISAAQIQSVLGSDIVQSFAGKLGVNTEDAASTLANFLPGAVDKLTPNGEVGDIDLLSLVGGFFGNKAN